MMPMFCSFLSSLLLYTASNAFLRSMKTAIHARPLSLAFCMNVVISNNAVVVFENCRKCNNNIFDQELALLFGHRTLQDFIFDGKQRACMVVFVVFFVPAFEEHLELHRY